MLLKLQFLILTFYNKESIKENIKYMYMLYHITQRKFIVCIKDIFII